MKPRNLGVLCIFINTLCFAQPSQAALVQMQDSFTGSSLDPAWSVQLLGSTGWSPFFDGTRMLVYDVQDPTVNQDWAYVSLKRGFTAVDDFVADFNFGYDSLIISTGVQSNLPMQSLRLNLLDESGNTIVTAAFTDAYNTSTGRLTAQAGGNNYDSGYGSMPTNLSVATHIQRDLAGNTTVAFNGTNRLSAMTSSPIAGAEIVFGFYWASTGAGNSFFAQENVDLLNITGNTPVSAVPLPAATWFFVSGLLGLIGIAKRGQDPFSEEESN